MVLLELGAASANPLSRKAATAAVVALAGDALAQHSDATVSRYQLARGSSFACFGAVYTGAFQHILFGWLRDHCNGSARNQAPVYTAQPAASASVLPTTLALLSRVLDRGETDETLTNRDLPLPRSPDSR